MDLQILYCSARSVVIEIMDADIYKTVEYEVFLNGELFQTSTNMILQLFHLQPDEQYKVELKRNGYVFAATLFHTLDEYVTLDVRMFDAKGDGVTDDTMAIQTAILCCPPKGRVYIPEGQYRIRTLFLKSNLILEIDKGATLISSQKRDEFPILPGMIKGRDQEVEYNLGSWEGEPQDTMVSILTGIQVENVLIYGEGTIDGGGDFEQWWVHGNGGSLRRQVVRRPRNIFLNHCKNIVIHGITLMNSPSWNVHPYFSQDIQIYGIQLLSPEKSHNTDGIDPESCQNVKIAGVRFCVGDDCIAIKSGQIYMGRKYKTPSQNIHIWQCNMEYGHGAVTIGSEISGGVNHVLVEKCLFHNTDRGLRLKTRRGRGRDCVVDQIVFKDINMDGVATPFVINCYYHCGSDGKTDYVATREKLPVDERTPVIGAIVCQNIRCINAEYAGICVFGIPEQKIKSFCLKDIWMQFRLDAREGLPVSMRDCPKMSKQGMWVENIEKFVLNNVHIDGNAGADQIMGIDMFERD